MERGNYFQKHGVEKKKPKTKNVVLKQVDNEMGKKMTLDLHLTLYTNNN